MDKLRIRGGRTLQGSVDISGAKNAALPELCAALLTEEAVVLENVPRLQDVATMLKLVRNMGVQAQRDEAQPTRVRLDASALDKPEAPYELVKTMRAALGALWPRHGVAARRLRHRLATGGPAHQGLAGHGRRNHRRARLHDR
jgi:UDP-N-acetylglucosamine 1-carboxyvinyltransferase